MQAPLFEKAHLTGQTDRPLIPANQSCERYIWLTLRLPNPPRQTDRLPLNLSLIVDRSGSMSGDKLEYVKEAAIHALRLLTEADRAAVVIYDDAVELLAPSRAITGDARDDMIRRIRQIRSGGMTNLSGGWFTGCDQIADFMTKDYLNRALLLTDGLANVGMTDHEQLVMQAKELRRRGISTTTFGVGHDFNQFLLQGIADGGGGHFYFIDKPNQIPNYFQGELGELLTTVARELTLDLNLPGEVEVEVLNDTLHERLGQTLRLFLGDAYGGEIRHLGLKLKLPARALGQDLALTFTLRYEDSQQRQPVQVEESLHFSAATEAACENQAVNEEVLREAGRLEAERAKMEALQREQQGDIPGAQAALRRAGVVLNAAMPAPVAGAFLQELHQMADEMELGLTEATRKVKHYQTYLAQRSRKDYKKS
ncbi:MAG: VWA domain-containing protein [Anaerolineae bacterium]|nr:VWA domain-containing protein [Anaerolineae bacterium]